MSAPKLPGTVVGIDVSHHNGVADWSPDGISFVIARASIGTQPDEKYDDHIAKARRNDLLVGAYHFNWSPLPVDDQVAAFIKAAGDVDLYALDVEGHDPEQFTRAEARRFLRLFEERTGKPIGLYMSESGFYRDVGAHWRWVANWGPDGPATNEPDIAWSIWQYGSRQGEDGNLGKSKFLDAQEGDVTPAPITSEIPMLTDVAEGDKMFDLDGSTLLRTSIADATRESPYEADGKRAVYTTVKGLRRLALVKPRNVRPVPPPPAPPDTTPFSQANLDAAHASGLADGTIQGTEAEKARLRTQLEL